MLCNIYVDGIALYTNVNSLIFLLHYSSQKISGNDTALNCGFGGFGFPIANSIKAAIYSSFINYGLCDNVIFYNNS